MRNRFPGYYTPTEFEFRALWDNAIFVPDTNILLHLFRYGSKTTEQVLGTFQQLKPRVWIPYQVGVEFHRRWREVDRTNRDAYDNLIRELESQGRRLSALFNEYTRHQTIDAKKEQEEIEKFIKEFSARIEQSKARHPKLEDAERILNKLSDLIGDAVGERPSDDTIGALVAEAKRRNEALIPPGFRDQDKKGLDAFGDFFIWREVLDKAQAEQKPVILVTDDVKNDWWLEFHGKKIGLRPELVSEMMACAGQRFYIYNLSQFLDYATEYLGQKIDPAAIQEIKQDEVELRKTAADGLADSKVMYSLAPQVSSLELLIKRQGRLQSKIAQVDAEVEYLFTEANDANVFRRGEELLGYRRQLADELIGLQDEIAGYRVRLQKRQKLRENSNEWDLKFSDRARRYELVRKMRSAARALEGDEDNENKRYLAIDDDDD